MITETGHEISETYFMSCFSDHLNYHIMTEMWNNYNFPILLVFAKFCVLKRNVTEKWHEKNWKGAKNVMKSDMNWKSHWKVTCNKIKMPVKCETEKWHENRGLLISLRAHTRTSSMG